MLKKKTNKYILIFYQHHLGMAYEKEINESNLDAKINWKKRKRKKKPFTETHTHTTKKKLKKKKTL